jgi:Rrf2 family protein
MKLTSASSYALHAVVFMAGRKDDSPVASHEIARARRISEKFLLKVLTPLVRARVLVSLKGPNGGYRLARPASRITLLEVIEAVDGPIRGYAPLAAEGDTKLDRRLQAVCNEAAEHLRHQLEKVRISDLVGKPGRR